MSLGDLKMAFQAAQLRLTQALERHARTQGMEWPFFARPTWDAVRVAEVDYEKAAKELAHAVVLEDVPRPSDPVKCPACFATSPCSASACEYPRTKEASPTCSETAWIPKVGDRVSFGDDPAVGIVVDVSHSAWVEWKPNDCPAEHSVACLRPAGGTK